MLTYSFEERGKESLYSYLYRQIKEDIISGKLQPEEKLPSKRALAKNLNVSTITVENAYSQLSAEGYLYTVPKSGFFVASVAPRITPAKEAGGSTKDFAEGSVAKGIYASEQGARSYFADFVGNRAAKESFPFATWNKLMRETLNQEADKLMVRSPSAGIPELRQAIRDYLYQFRGIQVSPEQIIVGAGTEYLYGLIIQLLGYHCVYGVEDPGYSKISRIYQASQVAVRPISLDGDGVSVESLEAAQVDVLHISPSHHFPTGLVTPVSRRYELLSWAAQSPTRYIIEDDYDSEFRLQGKPIPSMQSIDRQEKVIYINTFSKSLTPTIRISYMVLPPTLLQRYQETLGFYSCTVSNFEQYTLAKFIQRGFLEKHINRMRNYYRTQRDAILRCIRQHPAYDKTRIQEEHAGLHFLLEIHTTRSDEDVIARAEAQGLHISFLSQYYMDRQAAKEHTLVIHYAVLQPEEMEEAVGRLFACF